MRAAPGDTIDLQPGVYHGEVAVIEKNGLRIRGLSPRPMLQADGQDAEGKAIFVVRADDVTLENLELRGCRVASGNGAGVRFERGRLMMRGCAFFDNEMGLLTGNDPSAKLMLDDCEFGHAPHHEGALHHLLYAGTIDELVVRRCRFSGGFRGHLLKSRARRSRILQNRLVDGEGGMASYELEFPNGGDVEVMGNVISQSALTDNPAMVSIGAEHGRWEDNRFLFADNTLVNHGPREATFFQLWADRLPAGATLHLRNNQLIGPGQVCNVAWEDEGNNRRLALDAEQSNLRPPR
jgi:hypothetical protein